MLTKVSKTSLSLSRNEWLTVSLKIQLLKLLHILGVFFTNEHLVQINYHKSYKRKKVQNHRFEINIYGFQIITVISLWELL